MEDSVEIRLDKWLWAARFFKTRSLAKAAIEGGKIQIEGKKAKPSKSVSIGIIMKIRQGDAIKTIEVKSLCDQRKGATEAGLLYEELQESLEKREAIQEARRYMPKAPSERPNKKNRRDLVQFKKFTLE